MRQQTTTTIPRIVIAGTHSGAGKTSIACALTAALRRRGVAVQTFKAGPDYLDPTHLTAASGRPCYNLDSWMTSREYMLTLFRQQTVTADLALIEGVMGLHDGRDADSDSGSTAQIARWLQAPVVLVTDVHGMARSLGALVQGFATFDPRLVVGGVIANRCGSPRHGDMLAEVLRAANLPPLVAAILRNTLPQLPSRHLGLVRAPTQTESLEAWIDLPEVNEALEAVQRIAASAGTLAIPDLPSHQETPKHHIRLGVARDDAFHFYYPDNLDALQQHGAELHFFSPLHDARLPENLQGLYFGGGYPEEYAVRLAQNQAMLAEVRRFAASGRPLYAECGGLMYLSRGIEDRRGQRHPMANILPAWTRLCERLRVLGYVEVSLTEDTLWGKAGQKLRGHEFHYSELLEAPVWPAVYQVQASRGAASRPEGFQQGNILASYIHLHWASQPEAAAHFVAVCAHPSKRNRL